MTCFPQSWRPSAKMIPPKSQRLSRALFMTRMMEAVRTSYTSVYSKETTWFYIPEVYNHIPRRENLKFSMVFIYVCKYSHISHNAYGFLFETSEHAGIPYAVINIDVQIRGSFQLHWWQSGL